MGLSQAGQEEREQPPDTRLCALVVYCFLALGIAARLAEYLHYRVLWQDEGYTGVTIATRSFAEFFQPLGLYQIVAPGYLLFAKLSLLVGGVNEYALRFPSLMAGLASLVLFAVAVRRWLPGWGGALGFAFFSSAGLLIYYAGEAKPYAQDVCVALLLWMLAAATAQQTTLTLRWCLMLGAAGAAAVWFSFPSCFVLAGIGAYQLDRCALRRDTPRFLRLLAAYVCWAASFAVLYVLILAPGMNQESDFRGESLMETMRSSWSFGFLPFPPTSFADIDQYQNQFLRLFWNPGGFRLTGLAAFVWLVGWWSLYQKRPQLFWLLLNPFIVAFAVSLVKLYPFDGRMILFLTPALFLVLGEGVAFLYENLTRGRRVVLVLLLLLLLAPATARAARNIVAPPERFELNTALNKAAANWESGDRLYLGFYDALTFHYCRTWYDFPEEAVLLESAPFELQPDDAARLEQIPLEELRGRRLWVAVWHHRDLDGFTALLESHGGKQLRREQLGGPELLLYQF
ncbi:MAG: hypothetical protein RLZZ303_205 [Candidatus Hydrogenedentota bacterium]|jgi:hypothetical protein